MRKLGDALSQPSEPEHLIRLACQMTGEYVGASRCYFAEVDPRQENVTVIEDWHTPEKGGIAGTYPMLRFLPGELWSQMAKRSLAITDVSESKFSDERLQNFDALSIRSFAAAPFIRGGQWVAAFVVTDSRAHAWREDEVDLLGAIAARTWPLVERARAEVERKRVEQALRVSEDRLRLSYLAAGIGVWEWCIATNEVYWSKEYREIYGLDATAPPSFEAGIGVVVDEDRAAIEAAITLAIQDRIEYRSIHRIRHRDKGIRWIEAIGSIVAGDEVAGQRMLGIARDVTEQKRLEEELRQSESQLRALADSMPNLAWIADGDGSIFWYNRGWYEYTGTTLAEMQGWGWQSVHDPKVLPDVVRNWRLSIETGQPFEMLFPLRSARGEFRWFLTRVNPMRDSGGKVLRWFGTNTDIDRVKRLSIDSKRIESA